MRRLCVVDVEAERQQNTLIYHSEGRLVSWIEVRETPPGIRTRLSELSLLQERVIIQRIRGWLMVHLLAGIDRRLPSRRIRTRLMAR